MSVPGETIVNLRAQVNQKLVESGAYERISSHLAKRLHECGWYSDMKDHTLFKVRHQEKPNFEALVKEIEPKGLATVPEDLKTEVLGMIRKFLEEVVTVDDVDNC
ncbi:uncharacterized protein T551_01868 [Pneumocystis jirovecii RU7]|uniref:Transcription and mRNA export factor SUS1 n=1 Tax=Pneumocystis jirovecii (strain RU7) TaxID=1408657 RepID=A0A0W4ZNG7_PNEJ7|nr:uncharacterized protein T551_01868 [Pneumocystis jirovecii RU7]KTW29924.1 hypothetical protein T551_01868 [Pneumocystis jirovecii RU7]